MPTYEIQVPTGVRVVAIRVPEGVAERVRENVEKRICCACGTPVPQDARYIRGQCTTCEAATRKAIAMGTATVSELMKNGELAPAGKSGRKPKNDFTKRLSGR